LSDQIPRRPPSFFSFGLLLCLCSATSPARTGPLRDKLRLQPNLE
jgi:hypothetical protein